jgi:ATP-dependent helicase/nuclease subunit A
VPWEQVAQRENAARANLALLWQLMLAFEQRYRAYKQARNLVDFNDLERHALRILALHEDDRIMLDNAGRPLPSTAALEYRRRFEAVLVDEYQDTNSLQEAVISLVTRDGLDGAGRPRFSVGDVKQSIYDFRGAEPALFAALGRRLAGMPGPIRRVVGAGELPQPETAQRNQRGVDGLMSAMSSAARTTQTAGWSRGDYNALFRRRARHPGRCEAQAASGALNDAAERYCAPTCR